MTEEDIAPYLIPQVENHDDHHYHQNEKEGFSALIISQPTEFTHHIHVDYDPDRGFLGLPDSWKEILDKGVDKGIITIDEVMNNKEDAARIAGVSIILVFLSSIYFVFHMHSRVNVHNSVTFQS